jgi:serine/threonine-protein kinase RsbT
MLKEKQIMVTLETDVFKARRLGRDMAYTLGFDEISVNEIEICVSELATNLVRHRTKNGMIILTPLNVCGRIGIEVRSEDEGPGIKDVRWAMKEGESTAGGLGIGLPAVKRLMNEFSLESEVERGTTVVARKWTSKEASRCTFLSSRNQGQGRISRVTPIS